MDRGRSSFDLKLLLVFVLCMAGAGGGAYLLWKDLNAGGSAGQGKPMAKVEKRESKVRRKSASSYIWANAQMQEDLYRKDSVQTGIGSAVAIRLNDGTLLELGENSLVVIDDIQNLSLNFVKGSIVVRSDKGDSRISVGSDGKAKFEQLAVRLTKPESLAMVFTADKTTNVDFAWEYRTGSEPQDVSNYRIEIAKDHSFKTGLVQSLTLADKSARSVVQSLEPGKYFWRITDKGAPITEISQFRVAPALALKPSFPAAGGKILTWDQDTSAQFRWLVPQGQDAQEVLTLPQVEHKIEIAKDAEFKQIITSEVIAALSGTSTLKDLASGSAFWRIHSNYAGVQVNSPAEKFSVDRAAKIAIELGKPDENGVLELQPQTRFTWACESTNVEYQLEVQNGDGSQKPVDVKGRALQYIWKGAQPGTYRWRVLALYQQKPVGETQWRNFTIFAGSPVKLVMPAKGQEIWWWDKAKPFDFEWKSDSPGDGYTWQVEVGQDAELKTGTNVQVAKSTSFSSDPFKFQPLGNNGTADYYWRVKLIDAQNRIVKMSETQKFSHGLHPLLKSPATAQPESGYTRNMVTETGDLVFSWSEVAEAEAYELLVFDPAAGGEPQRNLASNDPKAQETAVKVIYRAQVDSTKHVIKSDQAKNIPAGNFKWTVRPIDKLKRKGQPLEPRLVNFTYGDLLAPPEVTSPEVQ